MTPDVGRFVRQNAFLVAAVSLPLVVVIFFLLAAAIPRWTVPPPAYDLVLRGSSYEQPAQRVSVEFDVRDGRVQATVRPVPPNTYPSRATLFLFDHRTMKVSRLPVDVPDMKEGDPPRTVRRAGARDATRDRDRKRARRLRAQVSAPAAAPGSSATSLACDHYDRNVSLVNRGRVVSVALPPPYEDYSPVSALGWVSTDGQR